MTASFQTVDIGGMALAVLDADQLLDHMFAELAAQRGGWIVTANLDFVRRFNQEPESRRDYIHADLRVADGMPLVWASIIRGTPLPGRIAGSSLVRPLCERAAREGRSVYLLGGDPLANAEAHALLQRELPSLELAGASAPWVGLNPAPEELEPIRAELARSRPDIVLAGFGSPKQERVIASLRAEFPQTWWIGVGISLSFLTQRVKRAPVFVQKLGLEWAHRLAQEPRRLFTRYIVHDLPYAFALLGRSAIERIRK